MGGSFSAHGLLSGKEMPPAAVSATPPLSPRLQIAGAGCSSSLGACIPGFYWLSLATTQGPSLQTFP